MSSETSDADTERSTGKVRDQGRPRGLFRACMDRIRASHTVGQSLRNAALAAGLLTDAECYAELLGQFYLATAALEGRMEELVSAGEDESMLVGRVKAIGYSFKRGYERDLRALLGPDWSARIESWSTQPTKQYVERMKTADDVECVAAAFILHGPLVIGGGAMLKPRVERAFGEDAAHVFEGVIGAARGGRAGRRREFIALYDTLLDEEEDGNADGSASREAAFAAIVRACGEFMQLNNEMMMAVRQAPWWRKYVTASVVAAASALIWRVVAYHDGVLYVMATGLPSIKA